MVRFALALIGLSVLAVAVGVRFALLAIIGLGLGYTLERLGFGFAGPWRRFIRERNAQGILAQLLAIGLAAAVIQPLLISNPQFIGAVAPVSISMVLAAAVFGFAMQLVLGCGSGTLVNAGSGNLVALVALPFFCVGSFLGTLILPSALATFTHTTVDLTQMGGGLSVSLTWAGLLLVGLIAVSRSTGSRINPKLLKAAVIVAVLAILHVLVAGQPWGVVYGLGLWVAKLAVGFGWDPSGAAFWSHSVNQATLQASILTDVTSLTSMGLVAGAAWAAWNSSDATPLSPRLAKWIWLWVAAAGLVLGISSRLAFGCNVGGLFSGIASGSLHGWAWLFAGFLGSIAGVRLRDSLWARGSAQ